MEESDMYYGQNPYMNPYGYNPYQPQQMQQSYQQYQNQYQPMQTMQTAQAALATPAVPLTIPGQMVDSFEAAKAKDIDMSGSPRYYPNINGSEIYMKQLQSDGTCPTIVYRKVIDQPTQPAAPVQQVNIDPVVAVINDMRQQIVQEVIEAVKQTIGS